MAKSLKLEVIRHKDYYQLNVNGLPVDTASSLPIDDFTLMSKIALAVRNWRYPMEDMNSHLKWSKYESTSEVETLTSKDNRHKPTKDDWKKLGGDEGKIEENR